MPEWVERDRRQVITQPVGVVDLGGVAGRVGAMGSRQADQVAGVVGQIGDRLGGVADREAKRQGEAAGWTDPLVRDASGALKPPSLEQGLLLSEGEKARRGVLAVRYGAQFVQENQAALVNLRSAAGADPAAFVKAAEAHRDGVLSAMPAELRPTVGEGISREIARHYNSMQADRLERERKDAFERSTQVLADSVRDLSNLEQGGPKTAGAAAEVRAGIDQQLSGMVKAGLILPAQADAQRRQLLEILPLTLRSQGEAARSSPTAAKAMVQALLDGPGSPGWRPEWNVLREDERKSLAQVIDRSASHRRAEIEYGDSQAQKSAMARLATIAVELQQLGEAALKGALTPEQANRRVQLEAAIPGLAATARSMGAAGLLSVVDRAERAGEAQRGQEALAHDTIRRSLQMLPGADEPFGSPATSAFAARVANLPLGVQAQLWHREAAEAEARARGEAATAKPLQQVLAAFEGGTKVDDNAAHQAVVLNLASQAGGGDPLSPAGMPMLVQGARAGTVPQQVVVAASGALAAGTSPQRMLQMTQLHSAMMADPVAKDRWVASMDDRLVRAYSYLADRLPGLDLSKPENKAEVETVRTMAAKLAAGVPIHEDARAAIGADAPKKIDAAVAAATGTAVEALPPEMRRRLNDLVLEGVAAGQDVNSAAELGLAMLRARQGWGLSQLGANILPQPESRSVAGMLLAGDFNAELPARWVRDAPEQHVAPYGAGGEVGTRWIGETMKDVAKAAGIPNAANRAPGRDLILRTDTDPRAPRAVDGGPMYQLHYQTPAGIWLYVRAKDAQGQETAEPLRLDLAAEAKRHAERWAAPGGGADQKRSVEDRIVRRDKEWPLNPLSVPTLYGKVRDALR